MLPFERQFPWFSRQGLAWILLLLVLGLVLISVHDFESSDDVTKELKSMCKTTVEITHDIYLITRCW